MSTIVTDWRAAVTDTDGDDTPMLVYCDWLEEHGQEELSAILREWLKVRTAVRMLNQIALPNAFNEMVFAFNKEHDFPEREVIHSRECWSDCRIGGCYTRLNVTPAFLANHPNVISNQPYRSMTLLATRGSESDLIEVMTNWRMQKLWHLDISYFSYWGHNEEKLISVIRKMKQLPCLNELRIRGVYNRNFKVSSTLIGLKKVSKGCKVYLGGAKEIVA